MPECHVSLADEITIGAVDGAGVRWTGLIEGWEGSPGSSAQSTQRSWNHGGWSPVAFLTPRTISVEGIVRAPDHAALHDALRRLSRVVSLAPFELRSTEDDGTVLAATVRRQGEVLATARTSRVGNYSISLVADDPFKYGPELIAGPFAPPTFVGGLSAPHTVPYVIDATKVGGAAQLSNDGTAPAPLRIRLDGPLEQPLVSLAIAGDGTQSLRVNLDLPAGQWLDIDTAARTVLLNGSQSRRGQITGEFPLLPPGGPHRIELRAASGVGTLRATYRATYW